MDKSKKLHLPKSVLDMKFMRKTKERIEKEIENTQDHEHLYSNIITEEMRTASGNYISESSFIFCEDLLEGRLSFKGMNPEIERLMNDGQEKDNDDGEMQKDIPDDILAKKMAAFHNKRKSQSNPGHAVLNKKKKYFDQPKELEKELKPVKNHLMKPFEKRFIYNDICEVCKPHWASIETIAQCGEREEAYAKQ